MASGFQDIDEQHQELIKMINRLQQACAAGTGKAELSKMMSFLGAYVETHFSHEENLMEEHRCPAKDRNLAAHREFLHRFRKLVADFEAKGESLAVLISLKSLVADWLANHICSVDTNLRKCSSGCSTSRSVRQAHNTAF